MAQPVIRHVDNPYVPEVVLYLGYAVSTRTFKIVRRGVGGGHLEEGHSVLVLGSIN